MRLQKLMFKCGNVIVEVLGVNECLLMELEVAEEENGERGHSARPRHCRKATCKPRPAGSGRQRVAGL